MSVVSDVFSELGRLMDQVSKEKGIDRQVVVNAVIQGVLSAARKKYGTYRDIEAKYNEESGKLELYEFKEVVSDEDFEDDQIEIKLSEALKMDPETQVKDQIGVPLEPKNLGRIDAYAARQIMSQNIRNAENEVVFNEFEKRKGEIASGVVRRVDRGMVVVDLEKTEAYIPRKEQIYGEKYNPGDRIQGYLLEVRQTTRGPQIIMSRAHPNYLIKLFEVEVPEIYEGVIKVVGAAREPGQRAKLSVYSTDSAVHPVGACVGMKGSRVQNITQELKGERIDVIIWDENAVQYVCNALAPAKISKVMVDDTNKEMEVVVPDDQLSLAIGKKGQNVRLAVNLTGWKLNIVSATEFEEKKRQAVFNLQLLPGITETMAENIFQFGISSFQELAKSSLEPVQNIPGYESKEQAEKLIKESKALIKKYKEEGKEAPTAPPLQKAKKTPASELSSDAKTQAEGRLKEALAELGEESQAAEGEKQTPSPTPSKEGKNTPSSTKKPDGETKNSSAKKQTPSP